MFIPLGHKKNPVLRADGPLSRVGQSGVFFFFGSKTDPKNTNLKKKKKLTYFAEKFWENILTFFKNFQLNFLDIGHRWLILQDFGKNVERKKKICQNGKFGSVTSVKRFFFVLFCYFFCFVALSQNFWNGVYFASELFQLLKAVLLR